MSHTSSPRAVEAYLSKRNSYVILCPYCQAAREFLADEVPQRMSNPFNFTCSCGETLHVRLVSFRGYRKPVNLVGSFMLASASRKIAMLCTVHDISVKGMKVSTDLVKYIVKDQEVTTSIILDDGSGTKLEMPARIARITQERNRLTLGLEFMPTSRQEELLGNYITG